MVTVLLKIDEINFTRTLKSFEEVKQIISNELRNLTIDFGKLNLLAIYLTLSFTKNLRYIMHV